MVLQVGIIVQSEGAGGEVDDNDASDGTRNSLDYETVTRARALTPDRLLTAG